MNTDKPTPLEYKSKLAPYIIGLIDEYRSNGYSFVQQAKDLKNFDTFIIEKGLDSGSLDKDVIDAWSEQRETESLSTRNDRLSRVRILAKYMTSLGIKASFPPANAKTFKPTPYILSRDELAELFRAVDEYDESPHHCIPRCYGVILRLYYHCGMRLNEPLMLLRNDVDLNDGTIYIRHSKGDKDRRVYADERLIRLLRLYDSRISDCFPDRRYFFPGLKPEGHMHKATIDGIFNAIWKKLYGCNGKHPTPHSLRHTFVVHRIDSWVKEGVNVNEMMPVLKTYLGHSSTEDTFYYYHLLDPQSEASRRCIASSGDIGKEVLDAELI